MVRCTQQSWTMLMKPAAMGPFSLSQLVPGKAGGGSKEDTPVDSADVSDSWLELHLAVFLSFSRKSNLT